jgi:hypothetical protein
MSAQDSGGLARVWQVLRETGQQESGASRIFSLNLLA